MSWCRAPAVFVSGPMRLNVVAMPISRRTGATCFMARWWRGANIKPMPAAAMQRLTCSGAMSMATPSASRTSALPHLLVAERLPCLATVTPAPAATRAAAVEMLNVWAPSPPVPQVSRITSVSTSTFSASALMARAMPTISSAVSPLTRRALRKAAVWASPVRPPMISSSTSRASSSPRSRPAARRCSAALSTSFGIARLRIRRYRQEVAEQVEADDREHAHRVELHAVDRQLAVPHAHHHVLRVPGAEFENVGQGLVDDQRVVAGGREGVGQPGEDAAAVVADLVGLAVHGGAGAAHHAPVHLADGLVPEADAEHRQALGAEARDGVHADPRLVRCAGAGRDDEMRRLRRGDLVQRHAVVALHGDLGAELAQVLHQVVGERVVVVDHEDPGRRDDRLARGWVEVDGHGHCENSSWASSMARRSAAALFCVSSYSRAGSLSATVPAGKPALRASVGVAPSASVPRTLETMWMTCE